MEGSERLVGGRDDAAAAVHVADVGLHEDGAAAAVRQAPGDRLAAFGVSSGDDDAGRAALGEELGGGAAETLGAPRDDGITAGKRVRVGHRFLLLPIMRGPETGRYQREGKWQIMIHGESYFSGRGSSTIGSWLRSR